MKLIDLLNENRIEEGLYSVTVDLMGPMKVQVKAKDEKEAKKIVASKLQRGMRDVKGVKKISEEIKPLDEAINLPEGTHEVKTDRFGIIRFIVDENVVGPGYPQQLMIQINYIGGSAGQIGHFLIEGNIRKPKSPAKVIFKKGKTSVKLP